MDNKEEKLDETKEKEVEDLKNEDVDATDAPAQEATSDDNTSKSKDTKKKTKKDEVAKLKEEIEKLKNDNLKLKEDYLRCLADMENTKRRLNEDALKQKKYASQGLVESLVTPVDMLDKVSSMETESTELQNFLVGFKMISKQLIDILEADGSLLQRNPH